MLLVPWQRTVCAVCKSTGNTIVTLPKIRRVRDLSFGDVVKVMGDQSLELKVNPHGGGNVAGSQPEVRPEGKDFCFRRILSGNPPHGLPVLNETEENRFCARSFQSIRLAVSLGESDLNQESYPKLHFPSS